ncbi:MAG: UPF0489 family protein, partial [Candidatus Omnitrophica bacterium]|nr:UPF0489 family protein [Candidatus Omnitrophota bacterium]
MVATVIIPDLVPPAIRKLYANIQITPSKTLPKTAQEFIEQIKTSGQTTGAYLNNLLTKNKIILPHDGELFTYFLDTSDWLAAAEILSSGIPEELQNNPNPELAGVRDLFRRLNELWEKFNNTTLASGHFWWFLCGTYPLEVYEGTVTNLDTNYFYFRELDTLNNAYQQPAFSQTQAPVWNAQDHKWAYLHWKKAQEGGWLPKSDAKAPEAKEQKTILVHFDAHSDLAAPRYWLADPAKKISDIQGARSIQERLGIDTFILPAVFEGLVDEIVWVVPEEAFRVANPRYQFSYGTYELWVGSYGEIGSDGDRVVMLDSYSPNNEGLAANYGDSRRWKAENIRKIKVHIVSPLGVKTLKEKVASGTHIILDIDEDFLGTKDPLERKELPDFPTSEIRFKELLSCIKEFYTASKDKIRVISVIESPGFTRKEKERKITEKILSIILDPLRPQPPWAITDDSESTPASPFPKRFSSSVSSAVAKASSPVDEPASSPVSQPQQKPFAWKKAEKSSSPVAGEPPAASSPVENEKTDFIPPQKNTLILGGGKAGGILVGRPFTGDVWVQAGSYNYKIWVENGKVNFQRYSLDKASPKGGLHSFKIGERFFVGSEFGNYKLPDPGLSGKHFSVIINEAENNIYKITIEDLNSEIGTIVHLLDAPAAAMSTKPLPPQDKLTAGPHFSSEAQTLLKTLGVSPTDGLYFLRPGMPGYYTFLNFIIAVLGNLPFNNEAGKTFLMRKDAKEVIARLIAYLEKARGQLSKDYVWDGKDAEDIRDIFMLSESKKMGLELFKNEIYPEHGIDGIGYNLDLHYATDLGMSRDNYGLTLEIYYISAESGFSVVRQASLKLDFRSGMITMDLNPTQKSIHDNGFSEEGAASSPLAAQDKGGIDLTS